MKNNFKRKKQIIIIKDLGNLLRQFLKNKYLIPCILGSLIKGIIIGGKRLNIKLVKKLLFYSSKEAKKNSNFMKNEVYHKY